MKTRILAILLAVLASYSAKAQETFSGNVVADEGAWCWFADPRALHYENADGSINATYIGYIDVHGNVKATQYDWRTHRKTDVLVRSYFQPDDHNNPTFIVLPDERVMIFYTRHTDEPKIWYRISQRPGDITALGEEKYLATANNTTYPSPFILSDDPTHIYLCWRGINWHPTIARLTMPDASDNCRFDFGPKQIVQSTGARPYAKYQSNGKDKIYLSYTTGHPDNEMPDWLYFNVIDINHGNGPILRDINGKELKRIADGVFNVNKTAAYASSYPATIVDNSDNIRNWVWQITLDKDERPVIAYPHIDNAKTTHVYWYARWTGTEWRRTWVQYGGHAFHQNWNQTERCYSGGMAVDPDNVNHLYLSIPTRNGQYNKDGVYEIWRYTIDDDGKVAASEQITKNSAKNNARPFVIPGSKNSAMRLTWMNGDYYYWMVQRAYPKGYPTDIRCDYAWQEELTPEDDEYLNPRTDCLCLAKNKTLNLAFAMNESQYNGLLFSMGSMTYGLDADSYPVIAIGDKTYRSQNRLLTSDNWAIGSTGTSGDNHPTKLQTWVLTLTYDGHTLTTYRNGLVDQVIAIEGLQGGTAETYGDAYKHTLLYQSDYYACASPVTVQAMVTDVRKELDAEKAKDALMLLDLPSQTRTDLVLPTSKLGLDVGWASSNEQVLSSTGVLSSTDADTPVTLTATIAGQTREFQVKALARDIAKNLRYELSSPLDLSKNTATGFSSNRFGTAPQGLLTGLRSYTVLLSATMTSATKQPRLYDFGSASGNSLFLRADALAAGIKYNGGTTTMVSSATKLKAGTAYKLAVTYDAATHATTIYIDGEADATGTANQVEPYQLAEVAADTRNYIGRTQWWDSNVANDNQDFCGTIGDLRLYDICLTKEEILRLQGFTPEPRPTEPFSFRLRNSLGFDRTDETVEVRVPAETDPALCALTDQEGHTIPFEVVGAGTIRFAASVAAGSTRGFTLASGTHTIPAQLTYAAVKAPSSRADIAWENDLCAYRMYSSVLLSSEANTAQGVDVWFKKKATPVIDDMYALANYHNESQYGVDAYSVNGKRMGCGGTAVVADGHLIAHDPYDQCSITEQGALRSAFTLIYNKVKAGNATYTKTLHVETSAGALLNKATVRLDGPAATLRLAVPIYQHTDMSHAADGVSYADGGVIGWAENKSEGSVSSPNARFYQGAYVPTIYHPAVEVIDHHLCLVVDYTVGTDLTFYFGGGWSAFPTGSYTQDDDWFEALDRFRLTTDHPLATTSMQELPSREEVLDILATVNDTWQQRNPSHGNYFWNRAVYHIGNMEAYAATGTQQYLDFSTAWAERNHWWGATGTDKSRWQYKTYGEGADWVLFGDNQVCFQVYADLYDIDPLHAEEKIARAVEVMGHEISTAATDYLWWVDGLFMVMPIMTRMYHITGNQAYLDKMYAYWQYANSIMYDSATGLYFRDSKYVYPAHKTNAGKKDFWARGDGWIFAAFARVLNDLPVTDPHRDEYIAYFRRMAAALKDCQQAEGYWTRSLLDPAQAPGYETSGTALNTYAYAWGLRNGILDELEYGQTLERAWHYLATIALQPNGTVGYIQPIGENASPNTTIKATDYHDFGVGAYLMAAAEMSRFAADGTELAKLRITGLALSEDATQLIVSFNLEPDAAEATDASRYLLNGQAIEAADISLSANVVTITLTEPLDYGLYHFGVADLHSAEGGALAEGQQRTLLRTVPLDAPQTGIVVTAIGSQTGNPHTNVMDGTLSTRWSQEGDNQWIRFDLKAIKSVWAVDVAFYNGNQRQFFFKIQTSTNGSRWTDATGTLTSSGMTNELERYRFDNVDARYVRLLCSGNTTNKWNSPTEVRIRYDEPNGIDDQLMAGKDTLRESGIFDLSGRRVAASTGTWPPSNRTGIYIINGRKKAVR